MLHLIDKWRELGPYFVSRIIDIDSSITIKKCKEELESGGADGILSYTTYVYKRIYINRIINATSVTLKA